MPPFVEFKSHRGRMLQLCALSLLLVFGCLFGLSSSTNPFQLAVAYILGITFFGLCALFYGLEVIRPRSILRIDESGVQMRAIGRIEFFAPWSNIAGVGIFKYRRTRIVILRPVDPGLGLDEHAALRRIINRANLSLCGSYYAIDPSAFGLNPDQLTDLILEHCPHPLMIGGSTSLNGF